MKVLVAGATGAIGQPLISALIHGRHQAVGMTTTEAGLEILHELGAEGVIANALDLQGVQSAVARIGPDAVIEELTSLPKRYTPEEMRAAAERDRRVRLEQCSQCGQSGRCKALHCAVDRFFLCTWDRPCRGN